MELNYLSFFVGAGFPDESVVAAQDLTLDFIGADAGSIDAGPYQLAGAGTLFSEALCRYDLRRALKLARAKNIPFVVGSCGGSGTDWAVDWFAGMVREIAAEDGLAPFRMTCIYSELPADYLCDKIAAGAVEPLGGTGLAWDAATVRRSTRVVGVMGAAPFNAALAEGADVVLAGRTTDSAIFAAIPLARGHAAAQAWHAGKVAECGGAIGEPARPDLLHVKLLDGGDFIVRPLAPDARATPWSVAAHQLYENADPFRFIEPSGTLDASGAHFDVETEKSVRISGARFDHAPGLTMKLEGVEPAGYQSISMGAYNDPVLLEELPDWLDRVKAEIAKKLRRVFGEAAEAARVTIHSYGSGSGCDVFGVLPQSTGLAETFLLIDVVAPTQAMASSAATIGWHTMIHQPPKGWSGSFVTAAWPFNPPVIDRGLIHRFNVNHRIALADPLEGLRFTHETVG